MPTDIRPCAPVLGAAATALRAHAGPAGRRRLPNPLSAAVLAFFLLFFALPVLWLVLAATKTDDQLVHGHPLSLGSWQALRANWEVLTSFQDDAIFRWLGNSAVYSATALVITLCVAIPAGYALAMTEFRGRHTPCWWSPSL